MISVQSRKATDPKASIARSRTHERLISQFLNGAPLKNNKPETVVSLAEANNHH
jgi:hypothetical protein